jgi:hypothetical protein
MATSTREQAAPTLAVAARCPIALYRSDEVPNVGRRSARGEFVHVSYGVYAESAAWDGLRPWQRYLARVHAVVLTHPHAIFCHESAAALWGLPIFGDPEIVHILESPDGTSRLHRDIRRHTAQQRDDIVDLGGILVTGRGTTVVDIARTRHAVIGLAVADAAVRADRSLSSATLLEENARRPSSRGRRHARWALQRATSESESPLESTSRAAAEWLGFESPELQVEFERIDGGGVDRSDFWFPSSRTIGEADGDVKYDGSLGTEPATAIRDEKRRDRRLLQHADGIAHWGFGDVAPVSPYREVLLAAGARPVTHEETAQLAGMQAALRPRPRPRLSPPRDCMGPARP